MKTNAQRFAFSQSLIALAVMAAFSPAHATDDEVAALTNPNTASVSAGIGGVSGDSRDRSLWGQYNGMREHDAYLLLDFDYLTRDNETGTWTSAYGRNLGLDTRELGAAVNKQGDWKLALDYSEIVKRDIRTINTFISGAGTTTPTVNNAGTTPGTGTDLDLELKRKRTSLSVEKWLSSDLQFTANFKNEDKDGARLFGKGFACGGTWSAAGVAICTGTNWALLMLPEPIKSNTKEVDVKFNFARDKLALTAGYYGSFFTNDYETLSPQGVGSATLYNYTVGTGSAVMGDAGIKNILAMPLALPPDNQAHQLYIAGNYAFTPSTHGTFKTSYSIATQNEAFPSVYLANSPTGNLDGEVTNFLAQAGLTARPMPKLSLVANVRYEDKEDNTPIAYYNVEGNPTVPANYFTNNPSSYERLVGKLEGTYQLAPTYNLTLGVDYEGIDRSLPVSTTEVAGLTFLREKTDEVSYRAELRHNLSETLNGSISYINSNRDGSDLYTASSGLIVPYSSITANQGVPTYLANRDREKWRLMGDWTPSAHFSLQAMLETGSDSADTGAGIRGWRYTDYDLFSLDAFYAISTVWKLNAYYSHGKQTLRVNHSTSSYQVEVEDINDTAGVGLTGNLSAKLEVGANLAYTRDKNRYIQLQTSPAGSVPDVLYRMTELKLYGKYALSKQSDIRADLIHQNAKLDEWTWTGFTYSDGTSVSLQPKQNVTFVGVRYIYKFQ